MSDIIERLRHPAMVMWSAQSPLEAGNGVAALDEERVRADMLEAALEIERLRSLAGAVTPGPSLAGIKAGMVVLNSRAE